jgi:RNA polymerase sigma-70 factor (ECF subfamily)
MDQETFRKIRLGDKGALAEVYKANRDSVINWITHRHSCSLEEAKDIYQDAIVIFYNNVAKGKISEINFSISSYLHEVVRRQFLNKLKKDNRMSRGIIDFVREPVDTTIDDDYRYEQKLEVVHKALQELSAACKKLIQLKYFTNLSMESICDQLGYKNTSTTKNLKYKCMRILRRKVNTMTKLRMQM